MTTTTTTTMQYALRMMYEADGDPAAITLTQPTRPIREGGPFINLRTARALERAHLAEFDGGGRAPEYERFWLTDSGREAASLLPATALAARWNEERGRWVYDPNAR